MEITESARKHSIPDAEIAARIENEPDDYIGHMVDGTPIRSLMDAVEARDAAEKAVDTAVQACRQAGATWEMIGQVVGLSRQGALRKYRDPEAPAERPGPKARRAG